MVFGSNCLTRPIQEHSSGNRMARKSQIVAGKPGTHSARKEGVFQKFLQMIGAPPVMVLGVGSFAHSIGQALVSGGANVSTYLTRNYGHFPPSLVGPTFSKEAFPSPVPLLKKHKIECVIPQSIDWAQAPWAEDLLKSGTPIFSPTGEAMRIERERDFARELCADFKIPFPQAYVASNRLEAEKILREHPQPFVLKNP